MLKSGHLNKSLKKVKLSLLYYKKLKEYNKNSDIDFFNISLWHAILKLDLTKTIKNIHIPYILTIMVKFKSIFEF